MTGAVTSIKVAGRRLAVQHVEGSGTPIVFLHEGLGSIAMWRGFPARLCARLGGRAGIVYDRPGHGMAGPLPSRRGLRYLHEEAILVLPGLLDALDLGRVALFGHSDGGTIALLFAAAFPDRAAAVITEAAHVFVEPETLAGIQAAVAAFGSGGLRERLARFHPADLDALFAAWSGTWLAPEFRSWNIEAELTCIRCPTLVLQGADDQYGTRAQVEAIAERLGGPVETVIIDGCAHVPHAEAPGRVLDLAADFLARCEVDPHASAR